MKKLAVLLSLLAFAVTGDSITGCAGGSKTESADPRAATKQRVANMLRGKPDALTVQAADVLAFYLTKQEMGYLEGLDWRRLEDGGLFKDPIARKAIFTMVPIVKDKNLQARLLPLISFVSSAYAQTNERVCTAAEVVATIMTEGFATMATTYIAYTCIGAAAATGGIGAPICLAAGIVSAAVILANTGCEESAPDLPPVQAKPIDEELACNSCLTSWCTGTLENCDATATDTSTKTTTATTTSITTSSSTSTATYTSTVTSTATDTGNPDAGTGNEKCSRYKETEAAFWNTFRDCDLADEICLQSVDCVNTWTSKCSQSCGIPTSGSDDDLYACSNVSAYNQCSNLCGNAEALQNCPCYSGSACDKVKACGLCQQPLQITKENCLLDCLDLLQ